MRTDPTPMRATDARRTSARRTHGAASRAHDAVSMIQRHGPLRSVAHARPRYARRSRFGSRAAAGACVCRVARCVRPALRQCVGAPPQHTPHNHTRSIQAPFSCCLSGDPSLPPLGAEARERHILNACFTQARVMGHGIHAHCTRAPHDRMAMDDHLQLPIGHEIHRGCGIALTKHALHTCPT